jgi:transposase
MERAHCQGIFGLSDYHQERTSPTYNQRKNNPRQLHPHPMFMDDNARSHRARIVQHFLQQEAVQTIPWPAMSPDMNPIEHVWDFIG